jgi:hypothetical protein
MADTHLPGQSSHMALTKNVFDQAVVFPQVELAIVAGHDAGGILPPVLQHCQRIIKAHARVCTYYHPYQSAHTMLRD